MNWNEAFKISTAVFFSVGSASVIIFGLSSWLGKVWAARLLQKEKNEHDKDIEKYKKDLDLIKLKFKRYDDFQFKLYNDLWESLCDVKDILENVNVYFSEDTAELRKKISSAADKVFRGQLYLDRDHYRQLNEILSRCSELLRSYEKIRIKDAQGYCSNSEELKPIWQKIEILEEDYSNLMSSIVATFKQQLCSESI
jgi:hypothetical protein